MRWLPILLPLLLFMTVARADAVTELCLSTRAGVWVSLEVEEGATAPAVIVVVPASQPRPIRPAIGRGRRMSCVPVIWHHPANPYARRSRPLVYRRR